MSSLQYKNNKNTNIFNNRIILLLISFIIETAFFLIGVAIALFADIKNTGYYSTCLLSLGLGCFVSGFVTARKIKQNGFMNAVIYSLPGNLFYIVFSSALNAFKIDYHIIFSLILIIVSSAIGGIISVNVRPKLKIKTKR